MLSGSNAVKYNNSKQEPGDHFSRLILAPCPLVPRDRPGARARVVSGKYKQHELLCCTDWQRSLTPTNNSTPHTAARPDTMGDIRAYWEPGSELIFLVWLFTCRAGSELGLSSALPGSPLLVSGVSHFEFQLSESPRDIIASVIIIITRYDTRPLPMSLTNDPWALPALFYWEVMTGQPSDHQPQRARVKELVGGVHLLCPPLSLCRLVESEGEGEQ